MTAEGSSASSHPRRRPASLNFSAHELDRHGVGIDCAREGLRLSGVISLPTFNRGVADQQFLFVNSRPVKDRLLVGALRAAYRDLIARDRHPIAALFIEVPLQDVDVNVHPAKTEVRFRDPAAVRGLIVGGLRHALDEESQRSAAREQAAAPVDVDDERKLCADPAQREAGPLAASSCRVPTDRGQLSSTTPNGCSMQRPPRAPSRQFEPVAEFPARRRTRPSRGDLYRCRSRRRSRHRRPACGP